MTKTLLRLAVLPLASVALAACSLQGSVSDPGASGSSSAASPTAVAPPAAGTGTSPVSGATDGGGTSPAGHAGAGSTEGAPPVGGGPDRCHTTELTGRLVPGDAGAGQRSATLVLENTGGRVCTVYGYGGVGLVDGAGRALPTTQVRVATPAPVTLKPGASVSSQLRWTAVPGSGDAQSGACQPTAAALQVIPPDETDPLSVTWQSGPVCQGGTIQQTAYAAG